jgi:hypothetical protein
MTYYQYKCVLDVIFDVELESAVKIMITKLLEPYLIKLQKTPKGCSQTLS